MTKADVKKFAAANFERAEFDIIDRAREAGLDVEEVIAETRKLVEKAAAK